MVNIREHGKEDMGGRGRLGLEKGREGAEESKTGGGGGERERMVAECAESGRDESQGKAAVRRLIWDLMCREAADGC